MKGVAARPSRCGPFWEAPAMHLTRAISLIGGLLCAASLPCARPAFSAEAAPPEAIAAARSGLPAFLEKIPPEGLGEYGFAPGDRLDEAYPGKPYLLHEIPPAAIERFASEDSVDSLLAPAGVWYFPVMMDGEARAILVVDRVDGGWVAVSLGQASLAGELNAIRRQWPASGGYDPRLIVSYQAAAYFFSVPQVGGRNLTRIQAPGRGAVPRAPARRYAAVSDLAATIEALRPEVEENIRRAR
jgi:hypothetical protein